MNSCGLYAATESGLTYGDYHAKSTILGVIGIAICFVLTYVKFNINGREYKIRGALLIGIILFFMLGCEFFIIYRLIARGKEENHG